MARVMCIKCGYSWIFTPKIPSYKLKESYDVKCPKCGKTAFRRERTQLKVQNIKG